MSQISTQHETNDLWKIEETFIIKQIFISTLLSKIALLANFEEGYFLKSHPPAFYSQQTLL